MRVRARARVRVRVRVRVRGGVKGGADPSPSPSPNPNPNPHVCSRRSRVPVILRRPAYGARSTSWTRAPAKRSKSVAEKPTGRAEPAAFTVIAGWPGTAAHSASRSAVDALPRVPAQG